MSDESGLAASENIGVGLRFVAIIIDAVIFFILSYLIALVTGGTTAGGFELTGAPAFLSFILYMLYFILMEAYRGGTVGKLALGMRVTMEDGSPITMPAAIIRNLLRIVDALPGFIPYLVGAIFIWTSPAKQRLGDKLAKTIVIKK